MKVGSNIAKARVERKISRVDIAGRCGVSLAALSRIEAGNRFPSGDLVLRIADALRFPPEYLLIGRGSKDWAGSALARYLSLDERERNIVCARIKQIIVEVENETDR